MNKIIIPTEFKLNGKRITVEFDNEYCQAEGLLGEADFNEKVITLANSYDGKRLKKKDIEQTLYHELMHMILDAANSNKLKYNEEFVDKIGLLIHEYERTKKIKPL